MHLPGEGPGGGSFDSNGTFRTLAWELVRTLKGCGAYAGLDAGASWRALAAAVPKLDLVAGGDDDPTGGDGFDLEDLQESFAYGWERCRTPWGRRILEHARLLAEARPLEPADDGQPRSTGYADFVSTCGWLQTLVELGHPILLPYTQLRVVLAKKPGKPRGNAVIRAWLDRATRAGYLELRKAGTQRPVGGKAGAYRFDVTRFRSLREAMPRPPGGDDGG